VNRTGSDTTAPELSGSGEAAARSVRDFIDWASASGSGSRDAARAAIAAASANDDIARALCEEIAETRTEDHSRTLVAISILGELRSEAGERCLADFVGLPLPTKGTVVEGEILERTALETLQARAVTGLAYRRTPSADAKVLEIAAKHPSRVVRSAAIAAYLWNHAEEGEQARKRVASRIRSEDRDLLVDPRGVDERPW
jgi:hypothetical protein